MRWILVTTLAVGGCAHARPEPPRSLPTPAAVAPKAEGPRPEAVVLAPEQLAFVTDAAGGFPSMLSTPIPRLVLAVLEEPPPFAKATTADDTDDDAGLELDQVIEVDDEVLAQHGLARPPVVWLVTPDGACQATLGVGYVGHYAEGMAAWEVGYLLAPCASVFAPLAVLVEDVPRRLRWGAAEAELGGEVDLATWQHPLRERFLELGLGEARNEAGEPAPQRRVQVDTVSGTPLRQLIAVDYWPAEDACDEEEAVTIRSGLWDGRALQWLSPPETSDPSPRDPELVGALVDGDVPVAVAYTVEFQLHVALRRATSEYQWLELVTGSYHDEDVAFSGYSVRQYCGP